METVTYYGLPIEVREMGEKESIKGLKEFFNLGKEWASLGYGVFYFGISGVATSRIWNTIEHEVLSCAKWIEKFTHFIGPCLAYDEKQGHPLIKLALDKSIGERSIIRLLNVRAIHHEMLILATKGSTSSISQFEKGRLIIEKPHDVFTGTARQRAILDVEKDYGNISKNDIRKLIMHLLGNLKYQKSLAKRIKNPDDCYRLADKDIELIAKKSGVDFNTITTEEIRTMVERLGLEYVPVVDGDKY